MIRKLLNTDIDRVADIWLKTNLKTHYFISNQYWKSNYELVKEMMSQYRGNPKAAEYGTSEKEFPVCREAYEGSKPETGIYEKYNP